MTPLTCFEEAVPSGHARRRGTEQSDHGVARPAGWEDLRSVGSDLFTIGVEEEFFVVDPETRGLRSRADRIVEPAREKVGDHVEPELQRSQVETGTGVCSTLGDVRRELVRLRHEVSAAAQATGSLIAAAGTHPFSDWSDGGITPKKAYLRLERNYQQLAREALVCGCHIHVGVPDREEAIQVMNRVRPWLSPVLALSANSPFWLGDDTGYASFRSEVWRRWPMAGTPEPFSSYAEYEEVVEALIRTGSVDEPARIYWDVRPSAKFDTLEFRVTDVCMTVDEAVMVAGLVRALVQTCHRHALEGRAAPAPRPELLRAATWRAARFGLDDDLVDVQSGRAIPAGAMVESLLAFVSDALEDQGDRDEVTEIVHRTITCGTGAARQRRAFEQGGRMEDVVDLIASETIAGT